VGHIEAGLRSYDRTMPEEINRLLTDHCSDFLFAPTKKSRQILLGEGISKEKIFMTGNTIVDAVYHNLKLANKKVNIFHDLGLKKDEYFLATAHRQENVDNRKRFSSIIKGLKQIHSKFNISIIYPIHPRSRKKLQEFQINVDGITLIDPIDFLSFLQLEKHAKVVLTDSGGIQEEACILGTPCVTMRENTERPETVDVGSNVLAGTNPKKISECVSLMYENDKKWNNPFGSGKAGKKIIGIIIEELT
jgi:UDP-N-acetylglucosamine 2-epimerase (non-hydrolysing)